MIRRWLSSEKSRTSQPDRGLHWYGAGTVCILALVASTAGAQASRFPVTDAQVMAAMQRRQLPTQGVKVEIAAPVTTSNPNAQLEIKSVASVNPHETRLRISCRVHGECLPFFALAAWPEHVDASGKSPATDSQANAAALDGSIKLLATNVSSLQPSAVRVGTPATLEIEGDRIHLRFEVICLEKGSTGDTIRVTTRDHKQHFVGTIISPTLLKGSL